jgi:hypothetical protein
MVDVFIARILNTRPLQNSSLNQKLWSSVDPPPEVRDAIYDSMNKGKDSGLSVIQNDKNIKMFVIKTFVDDDATGIEEALTQKKLKLSDEGQIEIPNKTFKNPLRLSHDIDMEFDGNLESKSNASGRKFVVSKDIAASENLYYILKRYEVDGKVVYKLLYNPVHRKSFKSYYEQASADTILTGYGHVEGKNGHLDTENMLTKYCANLPVEFQSSEEFPYKFLDNNCNFMLNANKCGLAALFGQNRASFHHKIKSETAMQTLTNDPVYNSYVSPSEGGIPNCACTGPVALYSKSAGFRRGDGDSFVSEFRPGGNSLKNCRTNLQINNCEINIKADEVDIGSSELSACPQHSKASGGVTIDTPKQPDNSVVTDIETPSSRTPPSSPSPMRTPSSSSTPMITPPSSLSPIRTPSSSNKTEPFEMDDFFRTNGPILFVVIISVIAVSIFVSSQGKRQYTYDNDYYYKYSIN